MAFEGEGLVEGFGVVGIVRQELLVELGSPIG